MREEEYWPEDLTASQSRLYGMDFAEALLKRELEEDIDPIYVRELPNYIYVLDGHHRIGSAIVYGAQLDTIVAEEFDDCAHDDADAREILERQYMNVGENVGLPPTQLFEHMIFDAYEETLEYMRNDFEIDSEHINEAMRRASDRLEEWVDHNL